MLLLVGMLVLMYLLMLYVSMLKAIRIRLMHYLIHTVALCTTAYGPTPYAVSVHVG